MLLLHKEIVKKKMNLSLIKMQECTLVKLAMWRFAGHAKNNELKHRHGYDVASTSGLIGMQIQGAMAIFSVNLKRILTLLK
jgi:hypothetical protein